MTEKITFVGDIHEQQCAKHLMTPGSIQLGDLSLCGYDGFTFDDGPRFFIDGNHDYFPALDPDHMEIQEIVHNLYYIPRGYVSGRTLFLGGANSVDGHIRTMGFDMWPEEALTIPQYDRAIKAREHIEVVVSHDCPLFIFKILSDLQIITGTAIKMALDQVFDHIRPNLWIFGHHHKTFDVTIKSCRFICVATNNSISLSIPLDPGWATNQKGANHDF